MTGTVTNNSIAGAGQKKAKKKRSWLARNFLTIILVAILVVGVGLLLYPTFANWWNSTRQSKALEQYMADLEQVDYKEIEKSIENAKEYNADLANRGVMMFNLTDEEQKVYESQLNVSGIGIMGYIEINSLDVTLPIYHGVDESVLQLGIGHLDGTYLPVGAKTWDDDKGIVKEPNDGSHCVVSGHRGLPSSRLFTDLDKMVEGDTFALNIYNTILVYEVDQIRVVLPEDLSQLQLERGEDYCTLVTCTPYGINSHRLLVRGKRVSSQDAERYIYRIQGNAMQVRTFVVAVLMAAPVLGTMFLWVMIDPLRRGRRKKYAGITPELAQAAYMTDEELYELEMIDIYSKINKSKKS